MSQFPLSVQAPLHTVTEHTGPNTLSVQSQRQLFKTQVEKDRLLMLHEQHLGMKTSVQKIILDMNEKRTQVRWKHRTHPRQQEGLWTPPQRRQAALKGHCHQLKKSERKK